MQICRCDMCGDYTERELTVTFHDSLYSAGSVDLCPRCMAVMLDEFRRHISSPYYGKDLERINQIEKGLGLKIIETDRK